MKVGDLIRWNQDDYDSYKNLETIKLPWLEKHGIVLEVNENRVTPAVITVMWDIGSCEKIYADELEVINESR